jgi:hypothetical protein
LDENDKLLDNQDLAFLLKVSYRTLQRYRTSKKLPYFMIGHKTYYRTSDVRAFVREHINIKESRTRELLKQMIDKDYIARYGQERSTHYTKKINKVHIEYPGNKHLTRLA